MKAFKFVASSARCTKLPQSLKSPATSSGARQPTFPARLPLVQLDYVYARGLVPLGVQVPHGRIWSRMSDHLPLIAEFGLPEIEALRERP